MMEEAIMRIQGLQHHGATEKLQARLKSNTGAPMLYESRDLGQSQRKNTMRSLEQLPLN